MMNWLVHSNPNKWYNNANRLELLAANACELSMVSHVDVFAVELSEAHSNRVEFAKS
jgi:hypothetical protein